ncbi:MAG: sel1 repeat family protein [Alphaproteobacteria bacterium]|nr:sel1 repeat family protein [Alphaproteobacteria bacterium]
MTRFLLIAALALGLTGCFPFGSLIGDRSKGSAESPSFGTYGKTVPEVIRRGVEMGDAGAQAAAGYSTEKGEYGFSKREDEALRLYRLAAAQGNPAGLTNLAVFVATGRGVPRDDAEAARLLSLAARQEFEPAQLYLAAFYLAHRGNIADGDPGAIAALKAVVEREMHAPLCRNPHVAVAAARLYEDGAAGMPRDLAEARRLYQKMGPPSPDGCNVAEARERLAKMPANPALDRQ